MKKLISIILLLTLTLIMSGCTTYDSDRTLTVNDIEYECSSIGNTFGVPVKYECDDLIVNEDYYTQEELDEGFEDVLLYIQALEQRIIELENE